MNLRKFTGLALAATALTVPTTLYAATAKTPKVPVVVNAPPAGKGQGASRVFPPRRRWHGDPLHHP